MADQDNNGVHLGNIWWDSAAVAWVAEQDRKLVIRLAGDDQRTDTSGKRSFVGRNSVTVGLVAGAVAGLATVLLMQLLTLTGWFLSDPRAQAYAFLALVGGVVPSAIASFSVARMGLWKSALVRGAIAGILGLVLITILAGPFLWILDHVYVPDFSDSWWIPVPRAHLLFPWMLSGLGCGIAAGAVRRTSKSLVNGVLGGVVGGVLGGLLVQLGHPRYILLTLDGQPLFTLDDETSWAYAMHFEFNFSSVNAVLTMVSVVIGCMVLGGSLGLVDHLTRRAWLLVIEGPNRGMEFILERPLTYLGSASNVGVRLGRGMGVADHHVEIRRVGSRFELRVQEYLDINGMPYESGDAKLLESGDVVHLGGTFLRFQTRDS